MNIFSAITVYILIWWIVLLCALPFGIKNIAKPKDGTMPGAPVEPGLKKKLILTTIIATGVWIMVCAIISSGLISFHDMALKMRM